MTDWKEQYLAALIARDEVEKANLDLYDYCTRIADQKAELEKQVATSAIPSTATNETERTLSQSPPLLNRGLRRVASPSTRPETPSVSQLRQDLAKAQQERSDLQIKFDVANKELDQLKAKSKLDSKKIAQLTVSVSQLSTKLRDRDEELKGKAKLVENVQDENATLNLQLNLFEEQSQKLRKENQDLIDRWMARMGREAEKMNDESKFG